MARIRSVHPTLFTDEAWVSCSPLARVLYIGLMTEADDQGLFEWKPIQIKLRLLGNDAADVPALLAELVGVNLIREVESAGKKLGAIRYFRRFQRPKKPNAVFVLPPELRTYVGFKADGGEPDDDEADGVGNPFGTGSPQAEQKEDGGGRRKDAGASSPAGQRAARAIGKPSKRRPEGPIPEDFPDAEALDDGRGKIAEKGVDLDVLDQAERFRNHAQQTDRRCRDWRAAWRNWVLGSCQGAPKAKGGGKAVALAWAGPAAVRAAVERGFGDAALAGSYLASCRADETARTLVSANGFTVEKLRREAGRELAAAGWRVELEGGA